MGETEWYQEASVKSMGSMVTMIEGNKLEPRNKRKDRRTGDVISVPERHPVRLLITSSRGAVDQVVVVAMKRGKTVPGKEKEDRRRTKRDIYAGKGGSLTVIVRWEADI